MTGFTQEAIEERGHPVWAEVDLAAIRHNVGVLRSSAQGAEVMGVVKGYAYGHGNPACARAVLDGGATRLGVARVAEGVHLREAGIGAPIHVFTEPPRSAIPLMLDHDLVASVYTHDFARALSDAAVARGGAGVPVHVKIDTGMHRVGFLTEDVSEAVAALRRLRGIRIEGLWSHLAVADIPGHPYTTKQLQLFDEAVAAAERAGVEGAMTHIANSAATLSLPEARRDLVRCGVACYGMLPGPEFAGSADLMPALALRARVNFVKHLPAGDAVSYGLRYELRRAGNVVTVPAGYADGYDRRLSGKADVLIGGCRYRVSGTVCMDQFMVDVGSDDVSPGAIATMIGSDGDERVTAEELAAHVGTINYEVTARIPSRVPRIYLNDRLP